MTIFGQIVIGPPGAGKTTYCFGMQQLTTQIERKTILINLDFANDALPYTVAIDVRDFLTLQDAMEKYNLGPNGGLIFCMESLYSNLDWLEEKLQQLLDENEGELYVIIDCPGQIELYTHHTVVQDILNTLAKDFDLSLCSVHLLDSFYCSQPSVFISACLLAINTMLRLGLPHINVLSKVDLLANYGPLPFSLDFYTELLDLTPILRYLDAGVLETADDSKEAEYGEVEEEEKEDQTIRRRQRTKLEEKFHAMTAALCDVVNDFGLLSFLPINIEDLPTVARVLAATDKANGLSMVETYREYVAEREGQASSDSVKATPKTLFQYASEGLESLHEISLEIQEKYSSNR